MGDDTRIPLHRSPALKIYISPDGTGERLRSVKTQMEQVAQVPRPTPFRLPSIISLTEYMTGLNPVCHFSRYNYKVTAMICSACETQQRILTVCDTGVRRNLIKASILHTRVLASIFRDQTIVRLSNSSNHPLDTVCIVPRTVTVGRKTCKKPVFVVQRLGDDAILGCQYIKHDVKSL